VRIKEYSATFSEQARDIVHSLQEHKDLDCRFLAIRLSFSEFYKTRKDFQPRA
jgi:gamma-tubulin complex component 3